MVGRSSSAIVVGSTLFAILTLVGWHHTRVRSNASIDLQEGCVLIGPLGARDSIILTVFEYGLSFGETRAHLRASLGAPTATTSAGRTNPYSTLTDTVFSWTYDGLTFVFYRVAGDGREFLIGVELTGATRELGYPIEVGSTIQSDVLEILHQPRYERQAEDTTILAYLSPCIGPDEYIELYMVADTLRKIRWALFFE